VKEVFLNFLNNLKELGYDTDEFIEKIKTIHLLVPVVGEFSAGKSSIINQFLGENILPIGIGPETALPIEIRYHDEEFIEAVKENGIERFDITEMKSIKNRAKEFKYLKLYLNNEKLKNFEPFILVDMPGFEAPLELHNKAILDYLEKGVYFIVLMSVEKGSISKRLYKEIDLINSFRDFVFVLSKTNLKPPSEVEEIKKYVKKQLEEFDYENDIFLFDDKSTNLGDLIEMIDIDEIYKKLFLDELQELYFKIESEINTKLAALKQSKNEANEVIKRLDNTISELKRKKEEMIEDIKNKGRNDTNEIINRVIGEIYKNEKYLIELALKGNGLEEEIEDILKSVLIIELRKKFQTISKDVVDDIKLELKMLDFNGFNIDSAWVNRIAENSQNFIQKALDGIKVIKEKVEKKDGKIYKTITSILAILTNILNPIIELIIVFLPDIFESILKSKQEEIAREKIREIFNTQMIPKIKLSLERELPFIIQKEIENIINVVSEKFEIEIKEKISEIEESLKLKEELLEEVEEEIEKLSNKKRKLLEIGKEIFKEG